MKVLQQWIENEPGVLDEVKRVIRALRKTKKPVFLWNVANALRVPEYVLAEYINDYPVCDSFMFGWKGRKRYIIGIIESRETPGYPVYEKGTEFTKKDGELKFIEFTMREGPYQMSMPFGTYYYTSRGFIAAVDVRDNYMPYIPDRKESK